MKRSISLILAIAVMFCFCMTPVFADDEATETTTTTPTATLTASLVGDTEPQAGETFTISLDFSEISSNLFKNGEVKFNWPADVASLYDSDYNITVSPDTVASGDTAADYAVVINDTTSGRNPKYTSIMLWDIEAGTGDITVYNYTATDKAPTVLTDGTFHFCTISFILGEDQSYEDFYFDVTSVITYLTEETTDIDICSETANGAITVVDIEPVEEVVYTSVSGQNAEGIYTLPTTITEDSTAEVEFDLTIAAASCNTLIGFNAAANMTTSAYFSGSSVMFLVNNGVVACRNGSANDAGFTYTVGETYHVSMTIDMEAQTWTATITDSADEVIWEVADYAFRTNTDVIDSLVLVDNNGVAESLTVSNLEIVVTEPVTEPTDEPVTDPTEPVTDPTDEPVTEPTEEPVTDPTDEPVTEPTDEPVTEPTEEETLPEDAIVADTTNSANGGDASVSTLDTAITTTGTIEFTLVTDANATNMLLAFTGEDVLSTTASGYSYFQNSGIMFLVTDNGTALKYRNGSSNDTAATLVPGEEYTFAVSVDVNAQTYSLVVTDAAGDTVATLDDVAFRFVDNAVTSAIDTLLFYEYSSGDATASYIYNLDVTADAAGGDVDEDLSVEVTEYTYTDGGQVIAKVGLIDGATEPTDTIVYVVSFTKDGSPLGIVAGEIEVGGTINVSNSDSTGVAAISFVTGITVEDVSPVDGDSDLGTPVGVYYPAE